MRALLLALLAALPAGAQTVAVPAVGALRAPLGTGLGTVLRSVATPGLFSAPLPSLGLGPILISGDSRRGGTAFLAPAFVGASPVAAAPAVLIEGIEAPSARTPSTALNAGETARGQETAKDILDSAAARVDAAAVQGRGFAAPGVAAVLDRTFDGSAFNAGEPGSPVAAAPVRSLDSIKTLRVGTYNLLNLFEKVGDHVPDPARPGRLLKVSAAVAKEESQRREQARAILESGLDIVSVEEVENIQALEDFSRRYLGGAYRALLIEGNDERGIDIAFLVKKDLPFELEHRTHKGEVWRDPILGRETPLFSRDLPALVLRAPGAAKPFLVLLGVHFKSKRDRPGDPHSETLRRAQVAGAARIVERYRAEFGDGVPLMLAGDFNGDLNAEDAFAPLWKEAGLSNSLELGETPVPLRERVTHTFHPKGASAHLAQMDGILVSRGLRGLVRRSEVYRYRDSRGIVKPIPRTYAERSLNPSDHFPLFLELDFQRLLQSR